uniref:Uncharacterized protein n=1 Tax=viral metagenome TaxID=1070528 RepID=A0A6C0AT88_9ZZZZ
MHTSRTVKCTPLSLDGTPTRTLNTVPPMGNDALSPRAARRYRAMMHRLNRRVTGQVRAFRAADEKLCAMYTALHRGSVLARGGPQGMYPLERSIVRHRKDVDAIVASNAVMPIREDLLHLVCVSRVVMQRALCDMRLMYSLNTRPHNQDQRLMRDT